jgi:excisionase family DNA binding protein
MPPKTAQEEDKYISVEEACGLLETTEAEIENLVRDGKLHAFRIGDRYLRLRKDQVSEIKARWRINRELFPEAGAGGAHILEAERPEAGERFRDWLYFNDFYVASGLVIAALLALILSSQ